MRALVDSDILAHELAWGAEFVSQDEDTKGDEVLLGFDHVENLILNKLAIIQDEVGATEPPLLFITNSPTVNKLLNRRRRWLGEEEVEFVPNFRFEVAKERPYKGTRANKKPFHFYNILAYFMGNYDVIINEQGLEADDALCMYQMDNAKEFGVKIPFNGGDILLDYEDWVEYQHLTFHRESKGYIVNDTGKGATRDVWYLHREIMGKPKGMVVDHINGDKLDNRKYNLRVCTIKENIRNSKIQEGTSKYKGVHWDGGRSKWAANIKVDRKGKHLGRYDSEEEAALAYDNAAREFFGEFARLNLEPPYVKPFKETIICSRDKDLRMCPLFHYSWECGKQGAIGPVFTDELGWIEPPSRGKIMGYGKSFFYSQLLTGDTVDNIAGLPGCGAVGAYKLLQGADSERALYEAVRGAYEDKLGNGYEDYLLEQGQLLYMVNETNGDESPKMWEIPYDS